jgi:hypothetical protein
MESFNTVEVVAEGGSVAGFFRTLNRYLWIFTGRAWGRPLRTALRYSLIPLHNILGRILDQYLKAGDQFALKWLGIASK